MEGEMCTSRMYNKDVQQVHLIELYNKCRSNSYQHYPGGRKVNFRDLIDFGATSILNEKEGLQDECINSYQSQMYLFGIELKKKILHQKFRAEFISKLKYSDKGTSRMTNEK
ncbi:hypothetical protein Tco_1332844 [Tanacetum coccineum]